MSPEGLIKRRYWPERCSTAYCDCPGCGYKGALAVTNTEGRTLYHCHAGCPQDSLWRILRDLEPQEYESPYRAPRSPRHGADEFVRLLWESGKAAPGTIVECYLKTRGISGAIPDSLRFVSDHAHRPTKTSWPIMLAAVTDATERLHAVHRTYLAVDGSGKAPVHPPKMSLRQIAGFACHLGPAGSELAVSEGIETGLSVQFATGIPTWAALSAGGLRKLILPPLPHAAFVTIAADADPIGLKSAQIAAARWKLEGRQVKIVAPPRPGMDFNDLLIAARLSC